MLRHAGGGHLGAQLGAPALWLLPVVFPMVMALGGFDRLDRATIAGSRGGIALSALLLGAMVCGEVRPKPLSRRCWWESLPCSMDTRTARSCPPGRAACWHSMGFVSATGCLHGLGIALGLHRWPVGQLALRGAGATIALWACFSCGGHQHEQ